MKPIYSAVLALAVAGCTNLPVSGPQHWDIEVSATASLAIDRRTVVEDYVLVDLTKEVLAEVPVLGPGSFAGSFKTPPRGGNAFKLGVGDLLSVTIFEASAGGLFSPGDGSLRPGNFVSLPTQAVNRNGTITRC